MTIYLDPMDELNTIVHKIRTAPDPEVVLVVPPENRALRDEINVKLLAKYAQDSQKQLAIRTDDPLVSKYAAVNQIPVIALEETAAGEADGETAEDNAALRQPQPG